MTRRQVLAQSYVGKSRKCCFPHDSEPQKLYAPQTKILEGWTKDELRIFEALFNDF